MCHPTYTAVPDPQGPELLRHHHIGAIDTLRERAVWPILGWTTGPDPP